MDTLQKLNEICPIFSHSSEVRKNLRNKLEYAMNQFLQSGNVCDKMIFQIFAQTYLRRFYPAKDKNLFIKLIKGKMITLQGLARDTRDESKLYAMRKAWVGMNELLKRVNSLESWDCDKQEMTPSEWEAFKFI